MTKIEIWSIYTLDVPALTAEANRLNKEFKIQTNDGVRNIFLIEPDLTAGQITKFKEILDFQVGPNNNTIT